MRFAHLPPLSRRPAAAAHLPDGHWRYGAAAAPFAGSARGACAYYAYHEGCCTLNSTCTGFHAVYVLNDGSAPQGFAELDAALAGGRSMLVIGDSVPYYLGRALVCLGGLSPAVTDTVVRLPSGGSIDLRLIQKCEGMGDIVSIFSDFDFVVANYGSWYRGTDRDFFLGCVDEVMRAMAVTAVPGKAAVFTTMQPTHFPSADGAFLMALHRNCAWIGPAGEEPTACLQHTSVKALDEAGYGASARPRGPLGVVSACRPAPRNMKQSWDAIIEARAAVHGVALVDVGRILRNQYGAHLGNYEHLDCLHSCFDRELFAPVWDAITRTLLFGAAAGVHPSVQRQPPLALSIDGACPSREPVVALIPAELRDGGDVFEMLSGGAGISAGSPRASKSAPITGTGLHVTIDASDLELLRQAFVDTIAAGEEARAGMAGLSVRLGVIHSRQQGSQSTAILLFLDVEYSDIATQVLGEPAPRRGFESVFLAHLVLPQHAGTVPWRAQLPAWAFAGAALGDAFSLRVFACEAAPTAGPRSGGDVPLCAADAEVGCSIAELIAAA